MFKYLLIAVLLESSCLASSFDEEVVAQQAVVNKSIEAVYKGLPIIAVTSQEYKDEASKASAKQTIATRANSVCLKFGYKSAVDYKLDESSVIRVHGWVPSGTEFVEVNEEAAWSAWSWVTMPLSLGVPVWYNHRIFKSITCSK